MFENKIENKLVHKRENLLFVVSLLVSVVVVLSLAISIIGLIYLFLILVISFFINVVMLTNIRNNGVKIGDNQFQEIHEAVLLLSRKMNLRAAPEVYIVESGGVLNAFASRFFRKNIVILNSSVFELLNEDKKDQLLFIIAHELSHHKRNHLSKYLFVLPALWIPFIGKAYTRACEFTCDRMATYYTENFQAAVNSLTMLSVGRQLSGEVNVKEYIRQFERNDSFIHSFGESFSTHPPLPKRISELAIFFEIEKDEMSIKINQKKKVIVALLCTAFTVFFIGGASYALEKGMNSSFMAEWLLNEGATPLMLAASDGDLDKVEKLIAAGADVNRQDVYGWTAINWALYDENFEIISSLLEAGADPNLQDDFGESTVTHAMYYYNYDILSLLLEYGADPNLADLEGWTPLMTAVSLDDMQIIELLVNAGADPLCEDHYGSTAIDQAKENKSKKAYLYLKDKVSTR